MSDTTLTITKREPASTRANQRLRKLDVIPGVLYGQSREPLPFQIERVKLRAAFLGEAGRNAILSLVIDGEQEPVNAILKAMEIDRVRDRVTHIDLLAISMTETFNSAVPIHLTGEAAGVRLSGGMVEHSLHEIMVTALPGSMPTEIVVDITELTIGHSLHIRDLVAPLGAEFSGDPDAVVCACVATRAAMSETGEAGDEAAAADGGGAASTAGDESSEAAE